MRATPAPVKGPARPLKTSRSVCGKTASSAESGTIIHCAINQLTRRRLKMRDYLALSLIYLACVAVFAAVCL